MSYDPQNFGALNANCSNMVECADFKIDKHASSDSPDMMPYKISEKWERSDHVTHKIHAFDIMHS